MNIVLILANGNSSRFGSDKLSVPVPINTSEKTVPLLEKTVSIFKKHHEISEVFVVGKKGDISGGKTRYESLCAGISAVRKIIKKKQEEGRYKNSSFSEVKILVHNGANPFVSDSEISEVLLEISRNADAKNCAVGVGRKITNTLRIWENNAHQIFLNASSRVIPRKNIYAMETPQGAFLSDFERWIKQENAKMGNEEITDELMLAEKNGGSVHIVPASSENIKITYLSDLKNIKNPEISENHIFPITGFGVDSHRFEENNVLSSSESSGKNECRLCGVVIQNTPKFLGNSDADVALHALCNAILSGLGKNSFSGIADDLCKNGEKNSEVYLQKILEIMNTSVETRAKKKILHLVLTFEGKRPKIEKYFPQFRKKLSQILCLSENSIGLNATTGEELDGIGRGEGMKVTAVVTMI